MKELILDAIYKKGFEVLFYDYNLKRWYNFETNILTDEEIENEKFSYYFKKKQIN